MSIKGEERRLAELHELEQDFLEAFEIAKKIPDESNFMREKSNRSRISATKLDVTLFTLESKIVRLREILGMEPFVIPMPQPRVPEKKPEQVEGEVWNGPPDYEGVTFAIHPSDLYMQILESQREPERIFTKVRCGPVKTTQGINEKTWRLASVECGEQGNRAKVILTIMPLPICPDAEVATQKMTEALGKLIDWSSRAGGTPPNQRPHGLVVHFTRSTRDLQFAAR